MGSAKVCIYVALVLMPQLMKTDGLTTGKVPNEQTNGIKVNRDQTGSIEKRSHMDLFSFATTMYGLVTNATDNSMASIQNSLVEVQPSLDDIQNDVDEIINSFTDIRFFNGYIDEYERIQNIYNMYMHNVQHGVNQTEWAVAADALPGGGLHNALLTVDSMITGYDRLVLSGSVFLTYERTLNRGSNAYFDKLQEFVAYILSLQAAGFGMWVNARIIKGEEYHDVQQLFRFHHANQDDLVSLLTAKWPQGGWGLPATNTGCPANFGFDWLEGSRYQGTDVSDRASSDNHFKQDPIQIGGIEQYFCMKFDKLAGSGQWPEGQYCVYTSLNQACDGDNCGRIVWADSPWSHNKGTKSGSLPYGIYFHFATMIMFICRDDGNPNNEIILPTQRPFYLLRHGSQCQKVKGTSYSEEWIKWDTSKSSSVSDQAIGKHPAQGVVSDGIKLIYCYYTSTVFAQY